MNLKQSFKIALKSIWGKKARSVLTMLGIIIGVMAVVIMVSIVQGSNKMSQEYYERMGTNKITVSAQLWNGGDVSQDLYDYCLSLSDLVLGVTPSAYAYCDSGIKYNASTTANMEYTPDLYLGSDQFSVCNNFTIEKGRDLSYLDVKKHEQVIVLGARVADYLFPYENPIGQSVTISGYRFRVIGVYAEKDPDSSWSMDNMAVVPYTLNSLLGSGDSISEFTIKAISASATTEAITRITGFLSSRIDDSNGYYSVWSENQWQQSNEDYTKTMSLVVGGIAGISLLVGGIGIMNIMLVTVTERTREIGIRMAIGAPRRSIILQFLIEAAVICAIGGLLGLLLGSLGTLVAGKLIFNTVLLPNAGMTIGAIMFSVVLGVGFGMYPAIKASALQPVEALRSE